MKKRRPFTRKQRAAMRRRALVEAKAQKRIDKAVARRHARTGRRVNRMLDGTGEYRSVVIGVRPGPYE